MLLIVTLTFIATKQLLWFPLSFLHLLSSSIQWSRIAAWVSLASLALEPWGANAKQPHCNLLWWLSLSSLSWSIKCSRFTLFSLCNYINITSKILVKLWTCSWATQWWTAEGAPKRSAFSWVLSLLPPANLWETASGHWTRWPALRAQLAAEATPCRSCGQGTAASPYWLEPSWSGRSRTTPCRYPWLATGSRCLKKSSVQKSLCLSIKLVGL